MSSHDCRVTGHLSVKDETTEMQVKQVLKDFLKEHGLTYKHEISAQNIQFDGKFLDLSLDVYGQGGYQNDPLDNLATGLAQIVDGWGYFEFVDFDTSGTDERCTPYFIATDDELKETARLMYGVEQMEQWVRPLVGNDAFETLTRQLVNLPRINMDVQL